MSYMVIFLKDMLYFSRNMEKNPAAESSMQGQSANETAAFFMCHFCTIFRISKDGPWVC